MSSRFQDLPLRRKMMISIFVELFLGGLFIVALSFQLEHRAVISLAETRVLNNLESARSIYASILENVMTTVSVAAEQNSFRPAGSAPTDSAMGTILAEMARVGHLDFLSYSDVSGRVIARSDPAARTGEIREVDSFFNRVSAGEQIGETRVLSAEALRRESPALAAQGKGDSLVMVAAVPVRAPEKNIIGILYGGRRIDDRHEIVDRIKSGIMKDERYKGRDVGAVTIYLGDIRVSTSLEDGRGSRMVGTRADPGFRAGLIRGESFTGRTRVLGEGYIISSKPLLDHDGVVVGTLSIGLFERPFLDLRDKVVAQFTGYGIIGSVVLLIFLGYLMTRFIRPLGEVVVAATRVAQGDLNLHVDVVSDDEIGELGDAFNRMTEELRRSKERLLQWTWTLESRGAERTRELQNIQESMARSEKMASLGQLSAGIAHEINNPLTAILLNAHLLLEKTAPDDPSATGLRLIAEETQRCAQIVKGLLDYSRQMKSETKPTDINDLIDRTVGLLAGQAWARNIRIVQALDRSLPPLSLDGAKIQQVFWNLILNACEAMPKGGELGITSRFSPDERRAEVYFADTGPGIPDEIISRIFDPFFTTKPSGTGLGLAVAFGIVEQHGGKISVRGKTGRGAVFTIQLPLPEAEVGNKGNSR